MNAQIQNEQEAHEKAVFELEEKHAAVIRHRFWDDEDVVENDNDHDDDDNGDDDNGEDDEIVMSCLGN